MSKMKSKEEGGSKLAIVFNGSPLFSGSPSSKQNESSIRQWIIENDMLESVIALPNQLFYNTGITTYIWVLSNRKPNNRKGKVQLIDAGQLYRKLRKNLGNKNCEFAPKHITKIVETYTSLSEVEKEGEHSIAAQVFDNTEFGYYKATIERPKRLKAQFTDERIETLRFDRVLQEPMQYAFETFGEAIYTNIKKYYSCVRIAQIPP